MSKILVVDDEPIVLRNCRRILEDEGYSVCTAENGKAAFKALDKDRFDLVVTDLMIPEVDGKELLKHVKETQPKVEIVVITHIP